MDLPLSDIFQIIGLIITGLGVWYKTTKDTEKSIEAVRKEAAGEIKEVKDELSRVAASTISRQEHDRDIENVKQEIRGFRDEVRDDIKTLNTTLTTRFDLMMEKIVEFRISNRT